MIRELRRFTVKTPGGTRYTVVETATFAVVAGKEVQHGNPSYVTSTGWTVTPTTTAGEFWIERLRLTVTKPKPLAKTAKFART